MLKTHLEPTLFTRLMFRPLWDINVFTTSVQPFWDAAISAVFPSWGREQGYHTWDHDTAKIILLQRCKVIKTPVDKNTTTIQAGPHGEPKSQHYIVSVSEHEVDSQSISLRLAHPIHIRLLSYTGYGTQARRPWYPHVCIPPHTLLIWQLSTLL